MSIYNLFDLGLKLYKIDRIGKDIYINILLPANLKCSWTYNGKFEDNIKYIGVLQDLYKLCNYNNTILIDICWRYLEFEIKKDDLLKLKRA